MCTPNLYAFYVRGGQVLCAFGPGTIPTRPGAMRCDVIPRGLGRLGHRTHLVCELLGVGMEGRLSRAECLPPRQVLSLTLTFAVRLAATSGFGRFNCHCAVPDSQETPSPRRHRSCDACFWLLHEYWCTTEAWDLPGCMTRAYTAESRPGSLMGCLFQAHGVPVRAQFLRTRGYSSFTALMSQGLAVAFQTGSQGQTQRLLRRTDR